MYVAIIEAGGVGRALASAIARTTHDVTTSGREDSHAQDAARASGAQPVDDEADPAAAVEAAILAHLDITLSAANGWSWTSAQKIEC